MLIITHGCFQVGLGDVEQKSDIFFFKYKFYTIESPGFTSCLPSELRDLTKCFKCSSDFDPYWLGSIYGWVYQATSQYDTYPDTWGHGMYTDTRKLWTLASLLKHSQKVLFLIHEEEEQGWVLNYSTI